MRTAVGRRRVTTIVNGLLGGAVAGLLGTLALALAPLEPPAISPVADGPGGATATDESSDAGVTGGSGERDGADATSEVAASGAARRSGRVVRAVVGVGYGAVAGATLVALELFVVNAVSVPPAATTALAVTLVWAGMLFFLGVVTEVATGRDQRGFTGLLVYHAVFGVALGVWIRLTWLT